MFANKDPALTFRKAKEFEINKLAASRMRKRFLTPYLGALILDGSPVALHFAKEILDEIAYLTKNEGGEFSVPQQTNQITDAMIEAARAVPVTAVIQFDRFGKAFAWCHDDKRPSLTFMSKKGIAWCGSCNRYFSALDTLIDRDQMSFVDAVKYLAT